MKAAFHTLGCKTNAYETQAMSEQFEQAGYEIVDFSDFADVYVINTCSVTGEAARKSRQMLRRAKGKNPDAIVAACGCFAQEAKEALIESKTADLVIGNNEKSALLNLVTEFRKQHLIPLKVDDLSRLRQYESLKITNAGSHVRAYVKIQDGCDRFCSYCIIPYLRGRSRSREVSEILDEVKVLSDKGIREIVLTGIDISDFRCFGKDAEGSLLQLLSLLEQTEGIERIRLGSLEEGILSESFVKELSGFHKLCPHFHLSLQSGCDETLKRMNRKYTVSAFKNVVHLLRESFHDPAITTDVIAGFPGETEEEFAKTLSFVKEIAFSQMHVFPYSRRQGTKADRMEDQISRAKKAERTRILIETGKKMQTDYMKRFLEKPVCVLLEEAVQLDKEKYFIGFTPEYVRVLVPGAGHEVNKFVTLYPTDILEFNKETVLI